MKTARGTGRILIMLLIAGCLMAPQSGAQELSERDVKKLERQATKADEGGRSEEAKALYMDLLAGTEPGDPRRATALWFVLMEELASQDNMTLSSNAKLDELLTHFPQHHRRARIEMLQGWRQAQADHAAELIRLEQVLSEQAVACEATKEELSGAAGEKEEQMKRQVKRLKQQLASANKDLEATRSELQKKEEALEKLKDALVGGGS